MQNFRLEGYGFMIKYYSADYILPVSSNPLKKGVVSVNAEGEIVGLFDSKSTEIKDKAIEYMKGIIVPGFVNSHCHLELSHLHRKFPKGEGLLSFIREVIKKRDDDENAVLDAIDKADKAMLENGIVAVGDISNQDISVKTKNDSSIYYHTYVELFGFNPEKAKDVFKQGLEVKAKLNPKPASIVPHAPYSVCKDLFKHISNLSTQGNNLLTIHNQETEEENKFYRYKKGAFVDFYKDLNQDISHFKPQARNSIQSILPMTPPNQSIMLVHNIYTSLKDVYFVRRFGREVTWCFCPNANLYIENRLPKIDMFLFSDFNITLGTDSLASNDELCILAELKTLSKHFPAIPLTKTISWATLNGAKFLRIDKEFGSIEKGKKPGLNLISQVDGLKLTPESKVTRLI